MSKKQCDACADLREYAPEFVEHGVTDNVCASLQNDTGLNPSLTTAHTNCDDLHDANDCLIGQLDRTLQAYDVCEWKEFTADTLLPNMYEVYKALICSDCGQWKSIHNLDDRLADLCEIVMQNLTGTLNEYGILVGNRLKTNTKRIGGEIMIKNNIAAAAARPEAEIGDHDALGILYRKVTAYDCSGKKKTYEWIAPRFYFFTLGSNVEYGDVVWRVSVAKAKEWGMTDAILKWLEEYSQWWSGWATTSGAMTAYTLRLNVQEGYLRLTLRGSLGDLKGTLFTGQELIAKLYIS